MAEQEGAPPNNGKRQKKNEATSPEQKPETTTPPTEAQSAPAAVQQAPKASTPYLSNTHARRGQKLNFMVYGPTGSGKSTIGAMAPKPVILLSELQGWDSIQDAAFRLGIPAPPTFHITSIQQLRACIREFQTNKVDPLVSLTRMIVPLEHQDDVINSLPYVKPETIVQDSTSDLFELVEIELKQTSPPKISEKDHLPYTSFNWREVRKDRCEGIVRAFRDLPYHILYLCRVEEFNRKSADDGESQRVVQPLTPDGRTLPQAIAAACNAVGFAERVQTIDGDGYGVQITVRFACPSFMMSKPIRPLRAFEGPDMGDWIARIQNMKPDATPLQRDVQQPNAQPQPKKEEVMP